jgi:hypothetical protein
VRKYTGYFILIIIVLAVIYDFYAIAKSGKDASISQYIIDWSYQYPMATFLAGFTCGHLFWRMPNKKD